jgi:16S rRNA (guanine527-N7)-methyltransferase
MPNDNFLSDGLLQLCRDNPVIENFITPRRDDVLSRLNSYLDHIELFNPSLSLVGTNDRKELILKHILDSLAPLGIMLEKCDVSSVADVGSGAGLPGIPLAVTLPDSGFTLIERKNRRAVFLRNMLTALALSNVSVEEEEMEKARPARFSLVTFRAFHPLEPKMVKKLFRLCSEGGKLAAYKGRRIKTVAEMAALEKALPSVAGHWELVPCPVPLLDEERHLLLLWK